MEEVDLQGNGEGVEWSVCDFKCSRDSTTIELSEAHKSAEGNIVELNNSIITENISKALGNRKGLMVKSNPSTKDKLSSDNDDSDMESGNKSNKNEMAEKILSRESQFYNEMKNKIFNVDNYINCSFTGCDLILYVEHLKKHLQIHETGYAKKLSSENIRSYICIECGEKFIYFDSLTNHIFTHYKEKTPDEEVCTVCGYKSKRLSSFNIHKCNILKVADTNIPEALQHKAKSVTNNGQSIIKQKGKHIDQEYNPSENSENSDNSDVTDDCYDDPDYQLPYDDKEGRDSKRKTIKNAGNDVAKDIIDKRKNQKNNHSGNNNNNNNKNKNIKDANSVDKKVSVRKRKCHKKSQNDDKKNIHSKIENIKDADIVDQRASVRKSKNINYSYSNDKEESDIERKNIKNPYKVRLAKLKVACTQCNDEFYNEAWFKDHLKRYSNDCVKKQNLIKEEVNEELGIKFYLCLKCNRTFNNKGACIAHVSVRHSNIKYYCDQCEFVSVRHILLEHMKWVHENEESKCLKCNKTLPNKYKLRRHMLIVHPSNPDKLKSYHCNICGKAYTSKQISEHMLTHNVDKPFPCKLCEFSTVKKYNFNVHMRAHKRKGSAVYKRTEERKNMEQHNKKWKSC